MIIKYLIAEYCPGPIYMGWHLYLRDHKEKQRQNDDGDWGWIRDIGRKRNGPNHIISFLTSIDIVIRGDGSCDDDGIAEIGRRFPIPRERIGGKPRGCITVNISETGLLSLIEVV